MKLVQELERGHKNRLRNRWTKIYGKNKKKQYKNNKVGNE